MRLEISVEMRDARGLAHCGGTTDVILVEGRPGRAGAGGRGLGDLDVGLDPNGHSQGMTGPVGYWQVSDVKKSLQSLLDASAQAQQEIKDVRGGKLVASVKDADGNVTGLIQSP
jgi:hypothetical protein